MKYMAIAETDVGISKETNQDSILIKHAKCQCGEVLLAVVCDGMGGLSKGELASATVVREFSRWFEEELPFELEKLDFQIIGAKWSLMLKDLNVRLLEYGQKMGASLGTTFTGFLAVDDKYLIGHVGDTRAYHINASMEQLTEDHTFIARELKKGTITLEQAKTDKRRNMLLQCIGASDKVEPDIIQGTCEKGTYMLCSDGFRHEITEKEILESLNPVNLVNKKAMHSNARYLIEENKKRQEKDNISAILIKAY
jgi:serine/threonine protein phosphatase PrpC